LNVIKLRTHLEDFQPVEFPSAKSVDCKRKNLWTQISEYRRFNWKKPKFNGPFTKDDTNIDFNSIKNFGIGIVPVIAQVYSSSFISLFILDLHSGKELL
jgi:hypothetical protein